MQFVTTIFDRAAVLSPLEREEVKNLIEFKLSENIGAIDRVQFRIFKIIGEQLKSEYLTQAIVQMKSGKRIVVDANRQNSVAAIRTALDGMKLAVAKRIAFENGLGFRLLKSTGFVRGTQSLGRPAGWFPARSIPGVGSKPSIN